MDYSFSQRFLCKPQQITSYIFFTGSEVAKPMTNEIISHEELVEAKRYTCKSRDIHLDILENKMEIQHWI